MLHTHLLEAAERAVKRSGRIPLDLAADMMMAGFDVEKIERKLRWENGL